SKINGFNALYRSSVKSDKSFSNAFHNTEFSIYFESKTLKSAISLTEIALISVDVVWPTSPLFSGFLQPLSRIIRTQNKNAFISGFFFKFTKKELFNSRCIWKLYATVHYRSIFHH